MKEHKTFETIRRTTHVQYNIINAVGASLIIKAESEQTNKLTNERTNEQTNKRKNIRFFE